MNDEAPLDDESDEGDDDHEEAFSLDELGAAYARMAAESLPPDASTTHPAAESPSSDLQPSELTHAESTSVETDAAETSGLETRRDEAAGEDADNDDADNDDSESHSGPAEVVTPEAIVEAALFVGHPENKPLTEERLASLMRGVSPEEVVQLIDELNDSYRASDQALRIIREEHGFRMSIAPEVEQVRRSFLGKVREARLNQAAIEVLALVAYQPGITAAQVQDQRGRESNSLLNQLVRRQLLMIERRKPEDGGRPVAYYFPTERFLVLFGLESLEDLPHVEEGLREV